MSKVWPLQLAHTDKLVLLALADNANDDGQCWPSVTNLCEKTCLSDRAVQQCVGRLTSAGHVSVNRRYKKSNVFTIHPVYPEAPSPERPSGEAPSPERNDISTPNDVHPLNLLPKIHEPSKKNRQRSRGEEPPPENLCTEAWARWVEYRRELRKPIKPVSILAAQRKLAGFGADQAAVVEQSIADGYQGLFALKDRPAKKSNGKDPYANAI